MPPEESGSTAWSLPHVETLTGTERIPCDTSDGGTANDSGHITPDDIVAYVEDNADLGGGGAPDAHADSHASVGSDPITPASIGAATVAEAGNALTAAQGAQTTADNAASAATAAQGTADNAAGLAAALALSVGEAQSAAAAAGVTADEALTGITEHALDTDNPHSVTAAQVGADPKMGVAAAHTSATRTLANADHNQHQVLNTADNSIALQIPDTLTVPFSWTARMSSGANAVTFAAGAGLITPEFIGQNTATLAGTWIHVFVESSTYASVAIVEKVP